MKGLLVVICVISLAVLICGTALHSEAAAGNPQIMRPWSPGDYPPPDVSRVEGLSEAAVDTYTIVYYDFETFSWQGWTRFDNTSNSGAVSSARETLAPGPVAYGKYSGLAVNLFDKDPCGDNLSTQIVFFMGSTFPSPDYPGLNETPFCKGGGGIQPPCQDEMVISPVIDLEKYSTAPNNVQNAAIPAGDLPLLGGCLLRFMVYTDLPLDNLVFYVWHVRNIEGGHHGTWLDRNLVYYDAAKHYRYDTIDISDLIASDSIQVALGVIDMCGIWYGVYGDCAEHTPAPWFDNVSVQRVKTAGPRWFYTKGDLFQDNFPSGSLSGLVRADMARDINSPSEPEIHPGDSIVVSCASPLGGGIDTLPDGRPAVYMHVKAHWIGESWVTPPLGATIHGAQLQGSEGTWLSTDAGGWDIIQAAYARSSSGARLADRFAFDLNDSLFVRGYMIEYYFEAEDNAGRATTLPPHARTLAAGNPFYASSYVFEFTCLPASGDRNLYVDDFDGIGSFNGVEQDYWDRTLADIWGYPVADRYDVNDPTSALSNGLASRIQAGVMDSAYAVIIWDSGDLSSGTISDGSPGSLDKANDCQFLIDFMDGVYRSTVEYLKAGGVWILGDNVAEDLNGRSSPQAHALLADWCGVSLLDGSYFDLTGGAGGGGTVNPLMAAVPGSFLETYWLSPFYLLGGCPGLNRFDVLGAAGNGSYELSYPDYGGQHYYAAIKSASVNSLGKTIGTFWFGFSLMTIRDGGLGAPISRNWLVYLPLRHYWMTVGSKEFLSGGGARAAYELSRNYPNPFNPATTIEYSMKERGPVTLRIYNVAGQLVRSLVDGVKDAGSYKVVWDGRNSAGATVASGIYFYKMETPGFSQTKKMVLLR